MYHNVGLLFVKSRTNVVLTDGSPVCFFKLMLASPGDWQSGTGVGLNFFWRIAGYML